MIYLDNAATTLIKPPSVINAISKNYANPGRGGHRLSIEASEKIFESRCALCTLFGCENPTQIIFTQNTTEALNIVIKGILSPFDHVIISGMEHNSVSYKIPLCEIKNILYDLYK